MVEKKNWQDLRNTGLVLIINQILHVFGWAIVFEVDNDSKEITNVYPARVKFRGFDEKSIDEEYTKVTQYMVDNAQILNEEIK